MARRYGNVQKPEHAGKIRQSQIISTFASGSIVDFVRETVMIASVDNWDETDNWKERRIFNNNLQTITNVDFFLMPKTAIDINNYKSPDTKSYIFPQKLYCPICKHIIDVRELGNQKNKRKCFMPSALKLGKPCGGHLVPSRFIIACPNGHIEDFPYSWWVHRGNECANSKNPRIIMYNYDNRSDIDSLYIECKDCKSKRGMSLALSKNAFSGENGYPCSGKHPHLGNDYACECGEVMAARLRSSSSVYFPATMSALTIPPWSRKAIQLIETEYDVLDAFSQYGEQAVMNYIINNIKPKHPLTVSDLFSAFILIKEQKGTSKIQSEADIFAAEYDVLCKGTLSDDEYISNTSDVPNGFKDIFDCITVIEKLTVINVLVGFTRLYPWSSDLNGAQLVPLSRKKKNWLPAVKLLGEGVFFKFNENLLAKWECAISNRYQRMADELSDTFYKNDRFSPRYVALHTFAHLIIRQLANDCGYNASSLKEKIYSTYMDNPNRQKMYGVLIYLATSDSEGSLGGLTSIANDKARMRDILKNMLNKAMWCSADPLCCNSTQQGFHSLNYSACHDCVLLPETSCEFRNVLLDRVSIIGKPDEPSLGLMGKVAVSLFGEE